MHTGDDQVMRRPGRLEAGTEKVRDQLVDNLQLVLHDYLNAAFASSQTPAAHHCGRHHGSADGAATRFTGDLRAVVEPIERLRRP